MNTVPRYPALCRGGNMDTTQWAGPFSPIKQAELIFLGSGPFRPVKKDQNGLAPKRAGLALF